VSKLLKRTSVNEINEIEVFISVAILGNEYQKPKLSFLEISALKKHKNHTGKQ
jgi:hypothetical protein